MEPYIFTLKEMIGFCFISIAVGVMMTIITSLAMYIAMLLLVLGTILTMRIKK